MNNRIVKVTLMGILTAFVIASIFNIFTLTIIANPETSLEILKGLAAVKYTIVENGIGMYAKLTYMSYLMSVTVGVVTAFAVGVLYESGKWA